MKQFFSICLALLLIIQAHLECTSLKHRVKKYQLNEAKRLAELNSDPGWDCSLPKSDAIDLFKNKLLLNPYPSFKNINPYLNQTSKSLSQINATLSNHDIVCAIKYTDDKQNISYTIGNFASAEVALANGHIITHQGRCGACSNLNDLSVYLSGDLTTPTRKCGMWGAFSTNKAKQCLIDLGFTPQCADIWFFNTVNTRQKCFWVCMRSWISGEPNTKPDGSLNDCLQCDEDKSGPVFQYFAGRTRRNSGIRSEIDRPNQQIYNMTHYYY